MSAGKIIKALSGFYYVHDGDKIIQCRGRGVFRKKNVTPLVGDDVVFQAENDTEGYIMEIKPRKNELVRPPIANIDQAILVFSADRPTFSPLLLDRFLAVIEANDISPVICITKMDLLSSEGEEKINWYIDGYRSVGYQVFKLSAVTGEGVKQLYPLIANKTSVLAGQSGVGKSSLLNSLHPEFDIKTGDISDHLGRGRHTTRHVELLPIEGGLVADTPGFSSLEFPEMEVEDLPFTFPEIQEYGESCRFRGCLHINEPGCAVKQAVETGEIRPYRYDHYQEFYQEIKNRKPRY